MSGTDKPAPADWELQLKKLESRLEAVAAPKPASAPQSATSNDQRAEVPVVPAVAAPIAAPATTTPSSVGKPALTARRGSDPAVQLSRGASQLSTSVDYKNHANNNTAEADGQATVVLSSSLQASDPRVLCAGSV